jgi:imidazolonepropionase-like amidohydrolase
MDYPETSFVTSYEPSGNDRVKLKNGRFVDVKKGCYFDPGTIVIIEGKKLAHIGPDGASHASRTDFTIDLKGKTVLPGLFNTHCHVTAMAPSLMPEIKDVKLFKAYRQKQLDKNMAECLIHGITHIRDAFTEDLRRVRTLRDRITRGEIPGPRIIQSVVVGPPGGYLTEKPGLIMRWMRKALGAVPVDHNLEYCGVVEFPVDANPQQVRDAVDRAIDERGAEMIKAGEQKENMTNFKPDSTIMRTDQLKAIADQAAKRGLKSHIHQISSDSFRRAVEAGFSSLAHLPRDGVITREDAEAFLASGCYSDPTLSVLYDVSFKIKGEPSYEDPYLNKLSEYRRRVHGRLVDEYWISELKDGAMSHFERADSGRMKIFNLFPMTKVFKYYAPAAAFGPLNLRLLFEMGAKLTTSNDGGIPPCTPAMMQHEIDLIDLFLNATTGDRIFKGADAVKMATIHSAGCLGLEDSFGSIEANKVADLVVLDGDPLTDCHVVGNRAAALFLDGRLTINNCGLEPVKL